MIRERRDEDLDRLAAILSEVRALSLSSRSAEQRREWLREHAAEQSWVFDMAPVSVAPTKNVVGHVEIYRPGADSLVGHLVERTDIPADGYLAIAKLFVKPDTHEYGIARHLLKESVKYVQAQGKVTVLDLEANPYLSQPFCEEYGFEEMPSEGPGLLP